MLWIGLTGGIGSGKSTVAEMLKEKGYPVVFADQAVHDLLSKGTVTQRLVIKEFGEKIVDSTGEIDRRMLAATVFSQPDRLKALEGILHPAVKEFVINKKKDLVHQGANLAFYEVPLLFENNLQDEMDGVLLVYCSEQLQLSRLRNRGMTPEEARLRIRNQMPTLEKRKLAGYVIENEEGLESLKEKVAQVLKEILQKAKPTLK